MDAGETPVYLKSDVVTWHVRACREMFQFPKFLQIAVNKSLIESSTGQQQVIAGSLTARPRSGDGRFAFAVVPPDEERLTNLRSICLYIPGN